ncbi:hypothetical protein E2C01_043350 [Portunus trituberculatus]|uniref:Uncharacterized protein n=1 Tax=Portunus trituberculatus TaxID=210409 RepID=A0A5B7FW28_PORTR|nr:hypothetical protein [Portunus trituberculatus]
MPLAAVPGCIQF